MGTTTQNPYLDVGQLAARFHTTSSGIYAMVHRGSAPPSVKIGKRRLFRIDDVEAWEAARRDDASPAPAAGR